MIPQILLQPMINGVYDGPELVPTSPVKPQPVDWSAIEGKQSGAGVTSSAGF